MYCSIIGVAPPVPWANGMPSIRRGVSSFTGRSGKAFYTAWLFTAGKCSLNPECSTKRSAYREEPLHTMQQDKKNDGAGPSVSAHEALEFHAMGRPGKLEISPTKPMATQRDLSLAYSPGVAEPVKAIAEDPSRAFDYTTRGNLVAVISNGTAILGLGNLGALASKPVMEGKAVLF